MPRRTAPVIETPALDGEQHLPGLVADPPPGTPRRGRRTNTSVRKAPAGKATARPRASSGRALTKAQMIEKVKSEAYAFASMMVATWEFRDPDCAAVMANPVTMTTASGPVETDRLTALVDRMVELLARNDRALAFAAQTGAFGSFLETATLAFPIMATVWKAHGPNGHHHRQAREELSPDELAQRFPAYSGR